MKSPSTSDDKQPDQSQDYPKIEVPIQDYENNVLVECPPHTTERKLMQRVDLHVMPWLCILYLLAFLDRINVGSADVMGLSKDLGLVGRQYNTALVIFFLPYILCEIPSNILMKKFKPHVWLSINMFGFGFTTIMQGLVRSYGGLLTARFFLGLFESGMFPGCFYLIGMWYRRSEAQRRYSFFFSSTTLAGAFGGLIAASIGGMNGVGGLAGWRWIFLLEGLLTVVVGTFLYFFLPSFPEQAKWLIPEEQSYIAARLRVDQGKSALERSITLKDVGNVFKDYKVLVAGFMYFGLVVPAYGYAYFAPGIIRGYGYSATQTQLHSVPPWAAAFVFAMLMATISDVTKHRFAYAILSICVTLIGLAILISVQEKQHLQYAALFLVTMGTFTAMPIVVCWFSMNMGGHHRRSVGSAFQLGFGNIGGIIAVFSFIKDDAPRYRLGYTVAIVFTMVSMLACCIYGLACWGENRQRARCTNNTVLTEDEKTELGDKSPDYRYLL